MGFLDVFKRKGPSHEEKVEMAYKCYKAELVNMVFPGGKPQAEKIICSLAKVYGLNLDACDAKAYYNILTTYSDVLIRRVVTKSNDSNIIASLMVKHGDLIKDKAIAKKALAFVTLNMKNNGYWLETEEDTAILDVMVQIIEENEQVAK